MTEFFWGVVCWKESPTKVYVVHWHVCVWLMDMFKRQGGSYLAVVSRNLWSVILLSRLNFVQCRERGLAVSCGFVYHAGALRWCLRVNGHGLRWVNIALISRFIFRQDNVVVGCYACGTYSVTSSSQEVCSLCSRDKVLLLWSRSTLN